MKIVSEQERRELHTSMKEWAQELGWEIVASRFLNNAIDTINETSKTFNDEHEKNKKLERQIERLYDKINTLTKRIREAKGWGFVYLMSGDGYYKIGYSKRIPVRRVQLATKLPFELKLLCAIKSDSATTLERQLHERFANKRLCGEWFRLTESDVGYIKSLKQQKQHDG